MNLYRRAAQGHVRLVDNAAACVVVVAAVLAPRSPLLDVKGRRLRRDPPCHQPPLWLPPGVDDSPIPFVRKVAPSGQRRCSVAGILDGLGQGLSLRSGGAGARSVDFRVEPGRLLRASIRVVRVISR